MAGAREHGRDAAGCPGMRRLNHMLAPGIAARCARLVLCAAVAGCTPPRTPADLVFDHVTVVDTRTGALLADRSLAVHAGRIVSIAAAGRVRFVATATRVDASGRYAVPGLWDAHTHVMQEDTVLTIRQLAPLALASGVTHIRDMSSSLEARRAYRAWARGDGAAAPEAISPGPALWGIRLPYGDPRRQLVVSTRAAMVQALDSLARDSVDFVKVYSGFGPTALSTLDTLARERGLALSGHVQEGVTLAQHAATGFRTIEHVDFTTFGACVDDPASYFARVIQARFGGSGETVPAVYVAFGAAVTPDVCLAALTAVQRAGTAFTPTLAVSFATPADVAATDTVALPPMLRADCARYLAEFARTSPADQAAFQQVGLMLTGLARRAVAAGGAASSHAAAVDRAAAGAAAGRLGHGVRSPRAPAAPQPADGCVGLQHARRAVYPRPMVRRGGAVTPACRGRRLHGAPRAPRRAVTTSQGPREGATNAQCAAAPECPRGRHRMPATSST